jgi:hypothetical protein
MSASFAIAPKIFPGFTLLLLPTLIR